MGRLYWTTLDTGEREAVFNVAVGELYAGTSGFSYPSWRGGFYPEDAKPAEFLRLYSQRLPSVELVGVFYRVPGEETFRRWAEQTGASFRFGVKMTRRIALFGDIALAPVFTSAMSALGEKLGPVRVQLTRARDDGFLRLLLDSFSPPLRLALDLQHESWAVPEVDDMLAAAGAVRVNALEADAPFRYLRLRDPPYEEAALADLARRLRPLLEAGIDVYCYFKHEDDPRGAAYAERLLELSRQATSSASGPRSSPGAPVE
jgi:uncharacterized protein YecE (DUF72 family)